MGKGQLIFKGEKKNKKRKREKGDEGDAVEVNVKGQGVASAERKESGDVVESVKSSAITTPYVRKGTGKITTSATVVTGHGTKFEKELSVGDAIMVVVNGQEELRVITMRLSNTSLNLSSAFSVSLKQPQPFQFVCQPKNSEKERKLALKKRREEEQEKVKSAFDLYSNQALVYREKTETGSYRIKRQELERGGTRGDLLDLRSKKTSDKYC
jgi:hypothetical protein